jgi:hypothetical protein
VSAAVISALCTGIVGVITAVVALLHSLQQAGILKAHLAAVAKAAPPDKPVPP